MTATSALRDELLGRYEQYFGEPDTETDVFVGFALFVGGVALGLLGLLVFLWSGTFSGWTFWQLREVAIALAMLAFPTFALGLVTLLPVDRRAIYVAGGGLAVALVAVGIFVAAYPGNWNDPTGADRTLLGTTVYALGLVVSVGATGAALVSYHLEQTRGAAAAGEEGGEADAGGETVTDEQVQRDIEEAMEDADISWGGVSSPETTRLQFEDDADVDASSFDDVDATTTRSSGSDVDDSVSSLRKLQGREKNEETGSGVDDQAAALQDLKEQKKAEEVAEADDGVLDRVRSWFG